MTLTQEIWAAAESAARGDTSIGLIVSIPAAHWINTHEDFFSELVDLCKISKKQDAREQLEMPLEGR